MILAMLGLALAGPSPQAALTEFVLAECGAEAVVIEWLGVSEKALREHDALRWTGKPCASRPQLRLELMQQGTVVARHTVYPRLQLEPHADRGAVVSVRVRRGSLVISAPGRLVADAQAGGVAKVINEATGTLLTGVLRDAETVEIR